MNIKRLLRGSRKRTKLNRIKFDKAVNNIKESKERFKRLC